MKRKVISLTLIVAGLLAFLVSWDNFVDLYYAIAQLPELSRSYFAIVGQGLFYFTLASIIALFGVSLLLRMKGQRLKFVRASFFILLIVWFVLELPIYKCDFYKIRHSFWDSNREHFH
jgi:hypothetical protein